MPCQIHLSSLNRNLSKFHAVNVPLLAIASDEGDKLADFKRKFQYGFPVIADPETEIIHAYNVYSFGRALDLLYRKTRLAIPSTFLLNSSGQVAWQCIGKRKKRPSVPQLLHAIRTHLI